MSLTLHIMGKDYGRLWPYLTLFYLLLIFRSVLIPLGAILGALSDGLFLGIALTLLLVLVFVLEVCVLAVIVGRLVQGDSTAGSAAFWLSRPVSGGRLLLSKSLLLALTVILPILLVEGGTLLIHEVTLYDTFRSVPQIVLPALLATLLLMMLASLTSDLPRMMFLGILAMVAVVLVSYVLARLLPLLLTTGGFHPATPWVIPGSGSGWMAYFLAPCAVAGGVVCHQFLTRRTAVSGTLALSGLLLAVLFMEFRLGDSWSLMRGLDEEILDPEQVSARVEEGSLVFDRVSAQDRVWGLQPEDWAREAAGEKRIFLKGRIALDNLPPDLYALPAQLSARLALPTGETPDAQEHQNPRWVSLMMSYYVPFVHFAMLDSEHSELLRQALGEVRFPNARGRGVTLPSMDLLSLGEDFRERHRATGIVYSAQVDVSLVQTEATAALRLEEGAVVHDRGPDRTEIISVETSGPYLTVGLGGTVHRVAADGWATATYVLRNPCTREVLLGHGTGFSFGNAPTWLGLLGFSPALIVPSLEFESLEMRFELPEGTWPQDVELVRIETRHLGMFSKTIRIEDFIMDRIPGP